MSSPVLPAFWEIHDDRLTAYRVEMANETLTMETVSEKGSVTTVTFTSLLAHHFEHASNYTILSDITQVTVDYYIDTHREYLRHALPFAVAASCGNTDELKQYLAGGAYKVYLISSSIGLTGTVIAGNIHIQQEPAQP